VLLLVRSMVTGHRVRIKTRVRDNEALDSLITVWKGADWTEREVFDMFGIKFAGHPDLRRILMYEEFEGHPLRKDYPIERTQPLVPYRDVEGTEKLAPFGVEEGQPYNRIDWLARMSGRNLQVSPAIALQQEQREALSQGSQPHEAAASEPNKG
jgi:NADH-quinone oxidoreductase subunit C